MANIYSEAKKDLEFILRNCGKITQPKIEDDNGCGFFLITRYRPEGYPNIPGKGEYSFYEYDEKEAEIAKLKGIKPKRDPFSWQYNSNDEEERLKECTLDSRIKQLQKSLDKFSREYNIRIYDKKFNEKMIDKTQKAMAELSKHRNLLPLIKNFIDANDRVYNTDLLSDFWWWVQGKAEYSKLRKDPWCNETDKYGMKRRVPVPANASKVENKVGCKPFPISLYAFSIIPDIWWDEDEDSIPSVAKAVAECKAIKSALDGSELQKPKEYIVLSLFD